VEGWVCHGRQSCDGIEAGPVDVQVQIANGNVAFTVVGLGDKEVAESRAKESAPR
jgi:magnesium chelatase family protein